VPTALVEEAQRSEVPSFASGGIVHAHTRDPFLASLPREALEALARTLVESGLAKALNRLQMALLLPRMARIIK
jgi:hypothetical protein